MSAACPSRDSFSRGWGAAGTYQADLVGNDNGLYPVAELEFGQEPGDVSLFCCHRTRRHLT
jgi:hypothetical protein